MLVRERMTANPVVVNPDTSFEDALQLLREKMTKRVITVGEDCPLEEAARIMVDHKIGSLPILRERQVVGIITETDIFRVMAEAVGGREKGVRVAMRIAEV